MFTEAHGTLLSCDSWTHRWRTSEQKGSNELRCVWDCFPFSSWINKDLRGATDCLCTHVLFSVIFNAYSEMYSREHFTPLNKASRCTFVNFSASEPSRLDIWVREKIKCELIIRYHCRAAVIFVHRLLQGLHRLSSVQSLLQGSNIFSLFQTLISI